jgi:hypothetical protein
VQYAEIETYYVDGDELVEGESLVDGVDTVGCN